MMAAESGFWHLLLEPGKKYEKEVGGNIRITQAILNTTKASPNDDLVQVVLEYEGADMVVANLSMKKGIYQATLDLNFTNGDNVSFTSTGAKIPVTLTGECLMEGEDNESDMSDDEEYDTTVGNESMGSDEDIELVPAGIKRNSKGKKISAQSLQALDHTLDSDESDDDSYNPMVDPNLTKEEDNLPEDEVDSDLEDEEESGDDDDEGDEEAEDEEMGEDMDSEEDLEEEEAIPEPKAKKVKLSNGKAAPASPQVATPKQFKVEKLKAGSAVKEGKKDTPKKEKTKNTATQEDKPAGKDGKTPKKEAAKQQQASNGVSPTSNKENVDAKLSKKERKERKKKNKEAKNADTPVKQDAAQKTPKQQVRSGGVLIEDVTVGSGSDVKNGNFVSMYYEGRLKSNGKVFDKNLSGPPFKFRLGRGEVIKGWDIGVQGMKIGGKRRITVPAQMGYGKQGAPPQIPASSVLSFEVTMLNFN